MISWADRHHSYFVVQIGHGDEWFTFERPDYAICKGFFYLQKNACVLKTIVWKMIWILIFESINIVSAWFAIY